MKFKNEVLLTRSCKSCGAKSSLRDTIFAQRGILEAVQGFTVPIVAIAAITTVWRIRGEWYPRLPNNGLLT